MSEEKKTEAQPEVQKGAELTVQDLASIKQIIEVASQRGSFKPNEMMTVGQVYTKLEAFLGAVQKQQQEAAAPAESSE